MWIDFISEACFLYIYKMLVPNPIAQEMIGKEMFFADLLYYRNQSKLQSRIDKSGTANLIMPNKRGSMLSDE